MKNSNEIKTKALGMPFGTATGKLRKSILFDFAGKLELLSCFRCGLNISSIDDFSIDHKQSWLYSDNPVNTFFSLDNIAFSHISCNVAASNRNGPREHIPYNKKRFETQGVSWCSLCRAYKDVSYFGKNVSKPTGLATECLDCRKATR
jgi:hypothetical protein